jgi:hypothetical protein
LPDGRVIALKKFAPMGSALCFPIETLIFAAICQYVTREHGVTEDYSVFGDDIIVPTQCVDDVLYVLEVLGFRANRSKSFSDSNCWFRESCGGEYCDGYDVTPMRVSRNYRSKSQLLQITGLVDLANSAYEYGFKNLRAFFLRKLSLAKYVPLFSPTSLLSDNYTNWHTDKKWDWKRQRITVKVTSFKPEYKGVPDEETRLRHWFESTQERISLLGSKNANGMKTAEFIEAGDGFVSETRRPTMLTENSWTTKPYEGLDQPYVDLWIEKCANWRTRQLPTEKLNQQVIKYPRGTEKL